MNTIGKLISGKMLIKGISPDSVNGISEDIMIRVMTDNFYTNSIPIILFKDLLSLLEISIEEAEPAMYATFEKLDKEKKEREASEGYRVFKDHRPELWENKEALGKYILRLKELITEEGKVK